MRRSLVKSLLVALLAAGTVAAWAGTSGASVASSLVICPLVGPTGTCCGPPVNAPAVAAVAPCCPQPSTTICCPVTAACAAPVTISSSPNPSVAGSAVAISGQVPGAVSGTPVTLWQQLPGQKSFHKIAQTTTSSSSAYTLRMGGSKVKTDRVWYVASGAVTSSTIEQVVKARVTVSARAVKLSHGDKITLRGKVDPSHGGQRVALEQKVGVSWRVLGHGRLNRKSRYAIGHRWAHAGVVKLRIALSADRRNAASLSPALTVKLTG